MEHPITAKVVFKSFIWKFLERGVAQLINLIVQIILARLIAPEHFGELAIIVAIVNFANIFVQSGMGTVIIQKPDLQDIDISTLTIVSLSVASVMYVFLSGWSPWIAKYYQAPVLDLAIRVLAVVLFFNAINAIQVGILSRQMQFQMIFYRSMIALPVAGVIGIAMAYMGCGIWALVFHTIINALVTCIVMFFGTKMKPSFKFSLQSLKCMLPFVMKSICSSLISGSHDMIRTTCIGKVYSKGALAFHDKGLTYSSYITQMISSSVNGVMLPTFARNQNDISGIKNSLRRSTQITAFFVFPILFGFAAVANQFVNIILTNTWAGAIPFIMLYCLLRLPTCIDSIDKQVFLALGRSEILLYYEIVTCLLNIILLILNLFVFPFSNGPIYITMGATFVEYVGFLIIAAISQKLIHYSLLERLKDLSLSIINSVGMFLVVYGIGMIPMNNILNLILEIVVGGVVYISLAILVKDKNIPYVINLLKQFFK